MISEIQEFIVETLIPKANEVLCAHYDAYCNGEDIGIETKEDNSPASRADIETEKALRSLIKEAYPDYGIWGEELGAENIDREFVWVLDPLDGTKAFLNKTSGGFGTLIGFTQNKKMLCGAISDPIHQRIWIPEKINSQKSAKTISDCVVSCTGPDGMFKKPQERQAIDKMQGLAKEFVTDLNCIGFARLIDGSIDVAIENDLKCHDIAALIPVLVASGITVVNLDGVSYQNQTIDLSYNSRYGIIAARDDTIAQEILSIFNQKEAA